MDADPRQQQTQIQAQWMLDPNQVPLPANQVLVQVGQPVGDKSLDVYLSFGHINPPIVNIPGGRVPTPEDFDGVVFPVVPVARVVMSLDRVIELRQKLNDFIGQIEAQK